MTTYSKTMTMVAAAALGCATASIWNQVKMQRQLDALTACDSQQTIEEQDEQVKKEIAAAAEKSDETESKEAVVTPLEVEKVKYNDDDEIRLEFSQRPDMDVVREYITVEPMNSGVVAFRYSTPWGRHPSTGNHIPTLTISGDFAHRTNVVLRIRKGFPVYGAAAAGEAAPAPLAEDFVYEFRRKDRDPYVDFADHGRYLPPIGPCAMAIKSVNVPKVEVEMRKVPAENVVFALSLEENEYSRIDKSWARSDAVRDEFFRDLAGEPFIGAFEAANEVNKEEVNAVAIGLGEGDAPRGLYLVRTSIAGMDRDDNSWWSDGKNQYRFRLVCVSDLGLSVRRAGEDSMLVWLNSFSTGLPVEGAEILVYSTANVLIAKGRTGADGLCRPDRIAAGDPFAVVAKAADGTDSTFIALRGSMRVDETYPDGAREKYLKPDEVTAFVWSERGIYRHDEKIFLHALLRNGAFTAIQPMPVEIRLVNPSGNIHSRLTLMTDEYGSLACDAFSVGADQPSGMWTLSLWTPGKKGVKLGEREIKIEEFAPPQIRVRTEASPMAPSDFEFTVAAEHLYGGAAKGLICEGAVVFEDVEFAPADWKGYRFGNDDRGLKPSFRRLKKDKLDDTGRHVFKAPLWESSGLPKAAVRATGQGTVFEDGGRPASTRKSVVCHYYPYYIGTTLNSWMSRPELGYPQIDVACVMPDGRRVVDPKRLEAKLERIDSVYAYRKHHSDDDEEDNNGWATWDCERVRTTVAEKIAVPTLPDGDTVLTLPIRECGDYVLTINDLESDVSFAMTFYLSDGGDEGVRAPLAQPTAVSIAPDKAFYRVGETPRLIVKSPFTGTALVTVVRDEIVWREVIALTNATAEIELPATAQSWAPNVDVEISVVQAVKPGDGRFAVRAHGETTIVVRPAEREIPVKVESRVEMHPEGGAVVFVNINTDTIPEGNAVAIVTIVDEGINLLTDERLPDPVAYFSQKRTGYHPLFDLYHRLLPVLDADRLTANGVKTGGGFGAEMLSRVSPVPSRRFKPLALWVTEIGIWNNEDGNGASGGAQIQLPEFVGEIRVTAVIYTQTAAGSACVHSKVAPKIVAQPDAPRFVALGDEFFVTLPLSNRSGADGKALVGYSLEASGCLEVVDEKRNGAVSLDKDASEVVYFRVKATGIGEGDLKFKVSGCGEMHERILNLPVRPAAAWRETAGVDILAPGDTKVYDAPAPFAKSSFSISGSRLTELGAAIEWLADYPHGCLEQTASRIFPLITAGGILGEEFKSSQASTNSQPSTLHSQLSTFVDAGVRRVESMIRSTDFVMWPDCSYAPWDREVSLYAAHFLVEAERSGVTLNTAAKPRVMKFLSKWAMSTNEVVSAYACHTLAIAGKPEKDRMLRLYDKRGDMDSLSRARLARAFTAIDDRARARELLTLAAAPQSVKEAAFSLLAMLELDPEDERIPALVIYLTEKRDSKTYSWGTTESNAHALLALGEYYRHKGWKGGTPQVTRHDNADSSVRFVNSGEAEAFVSWRRLDVPNPDEIKPEETVLAISRRILDSDGNVADLDKLERGDLVFAEITLKSSEKRTYSDLIVEDLFPAALEPTHTEVAAENPMPRWVMRTDARDDRMLIYSKRFNLGKNETVVFSYPLRVVSAGDFILPAASVEAMYAPDIHANTSTSTIHVSLDAPNP